MCESCGCTPCEKWENEIDEIVTKLYGLTKEEILIVEGNNALV